MSSAYSDFGADPYASFLVHLRAEGVKIRMTLANFYSCFPSP